MSAMERNVHGRVTKLETTMDAVTKGIEELKLEIRDMRTEMNSRFDRVDARFENVNLRFDSWLKWVLGFIFSSWLTLMVSIWLKR